MNATAVSRTIAASLALATATATGDIDWPSGWDEIVQSHMAAALPSGASAAFGSSGAFDSKGSVAYASAGYGDAVAAFDSVAYVTRFSAGGNIVTTPFSFCIIVR